MTVAILTPYDRSETTAAALRLAALVESAGVEARVVALARPARVHPRWDSRVWAGGGAGPSWAAGATAVVHFGAGHRTIERARKAAPGARQVLVVPWHAVRPDAAQDVFSADLIACPSRSCKDGLEATLCAYSGVTGDRLSWVRFDSGLPATSRQARGDPGRVRACFVASPSAIEFSGPQLLAAIAEILDEAPSLHATLVSGGSWAERDRKTIRRLAAAHADRFSRQSMPSILALNRAFQEADWVVLPGVRSGFGITAQRALACGCPVVAYDVPPFSEVVRPGENGILVPCESRLTPCLAPTAVPDTSALISACLGAFSSRATLDALRAKAWGVEQAARDFDRFWSLALG